MRHSFVEGRLAAADSSLATAGRRRSSQGDSVPALVPGQKPDEETGWAPRNELACAPRPPRPRLLPLRLPKSRLRSTVQSPPLPLSQPPRTRAASPACSSCPRPSATSTSARRSAATSPSRISLSETSPPSASRPVPQRPHSALHHTPPRGTFRGPPPPPHRPTPAAPPPPQVELQTDRARAPLFDTGALPLSVIPAGGRQDVVIEQDLKDLGNHTLARCRTAPRAPPRRRASLFSFLCFPCRRRETTLEVKRVSSTPTLLLAPRVRRCAARRTRTRTASASSSRSTSGSQSPTPWPSAPRRAAAGSRPAGRPGGKAACERA